MKEEKTITIWECEVCGKSDRSDVKEALAKPEHVPYRGVDIGICKGKMIKREITLTQEE